MRERKAERGIGGLGASRHIGMGDASRALGRDQCLLNRDNAKLSFSRGLSTALSSAQLRRELGDEGFAFGETGERAHEVAVGNGFGLALDSQLGPQHRRGFAVRRNVRADMG